MLRAAEDIGVQVIWDLCHYGWPDHSTSGAPPSSTVSPALPGPARLVRDETDAFRSGARSTRSRTGPGPAATSPLQPVRPRPGAELKRQLVRASIAAMEAIWRSTRGPASSTAIRSSMSCPARVGLRACAPPKPIAERSSRRGICSWAALAGVGRPPPTSTSWVSTTTRKPVVPGRSALRVGHPRYRPFREILAETYQRYHRPSSSPRPVPKARSAFPGCAMSPAGARRRRQRHSRRGDLPLPDRGLSRLDQSAAL